MPWTGVTAEKTFSGTDFVFPSGGSLPLEQAALHLPSQHAQGLQPQLLFSCPLDKARLRERCTKPNPAPIGAALLQGCCSVQNLLLLLKHNHRPSEVFSISILFFSCPVGGQGYETTAHLETQAADLYFWQPKRKVQPACHQHIKLRLIGTLQTREQKKDFE